VVRHLAILLLSVFFCHFSLQAQSVLFSETFANGSAENIWRAGFNGNVMEVHSMAGNPSGDGWVGKLGNNLSGGLVGESHAVSQMLENFFIEAKVYIPVNEGTYYGIEFRVDSSGLSSGYQFVARFKPGGMTTPRLRFRTRSSLNPAIPKTIMDWTDTQIPGGIPTTNGWHTLAAKVIGGHFWFYFDGHQLPNCPVFESEFRQGLVGAYVWDQSVAPLYLYIDDIFVTTNVTGIEEENPAHAQDFRLLTNFPNPFRAGTTIEYELQTSSDVQLQVYDDLGRLVRTLASGFQREGVHYVRLDGSDLAAGMYSCRLTTPGGSMSKTLLRIR